MTLVCQSEADHTQLHHLHLSDLGFPSGPTKEGLYQFTKHSGLIPDHCHGEDMGERGPSYDVDRAAQWRSARKSSAKGFQEEGQCLGTKWDSVQSKS